MSPEHVRVPEALRRNVLQVWGEPGRAWLDDLPHHLAACADRWSLTVGEPFVLSFHWVAPARTTAGEDVVLKLGVPGRPHLIREAAVLRRWAGRGAVRLLDDDPAHGALLLERAVPATTVADLVASRDEDATRAVVGVAAALHGARPDGLDLPDIASEAASFEAHVRANGTADPLPRSLAEQARDLLLDLTRSRDAAVLLHGDLHHDNVLLHDDVLLQAGAGRAGHDDTGGWVAIDPHGWIGDPGFEVGPLLYNPLRTDPAELVRLLPSRLEVYADGLRQPVDRLRAWGFVAAALSQVWSCEDGGSPEAGPGAVADALRPR